MRSALLVVGMMLLGGCGGAASDRDGVVTVNVLYGVQYTVSPDEYDHDEATAALERCTALPGASLGDTDQSFPPGPSVRFSGSQSQQDRLEACLKGLPQTKISGPHPLSSGKG